MLLMSFFNICYAATFQSTITAESGAVGDTVTVTVSFPANTNAAGGCTSDAVLPECEVAKSVKTFGVIGFK